MFWSPGPRRVASVLVAAQPDTGAGREPEAPARLEQRLVHTVDRFGIMVLRVGEVEGVSCTQAAAMINEEDPGESEIGSAREQIAEAGRPPRRLLIHPADRHHHVGRLLRERTAGAGSTEI